MAKNLSQNYGVLTPNNFIKIMTFLYSEDGAVKNEPSKMLWGQPGIGKSQAVYEFAHSLEMATGKKVYVKLASLLLMSPIDIRGIPAKAENEAGDMVARWLTPEIFQMDPSDDVINILFLDEISAAPQSVQACAYQICYDKRVGEHKLPDNTIVIAAGNRVTDKAVAYKMPKPLGNRLIHFEMIADWESWKNWAVSNNIDARIIGFLARSNGSDLNTFDASNDDVAFATPRSWEMANAYVSRCKTADDFNLLFPCIQGCIGNGLAHEFKLYLKVFNKLPKYEDIASGKLTEASEAIQKQADLMYSISSVISTQLVKAGKEVNWEDKVSVANFNTVLTNVLNYVFSFKAKEYTAFIGKDLCSIWKRDNPTTFKNVQKNAEYKKLMKDLASVLASV